MPLLHPAAALRTPVARRHAARGLRRAPGAARAAAARGSGSGGRDRRGPGGGRRGGAGGRSARPLRLTLRTGQRAERRADRASAETEALGARLAAGLRARRRRAGRGRARQRQDDAGPWRLPRARGHGAGAVADVHDRAPLRRTRAGVPPRPLPARRRSTREEPGLLDDYLTADAVAFVEWPGGAEGAIELAPAIGGRVIRVELRHAGGDRREIEIRS